MSNSLQSHRLQYSRLPCPLLSPGFHSNSCPLSGWYPTISSSVIPFSSHLQSFQALGFFSNKLALCIRWPKYWSFSFSISPSNEYLGSTSFSTDWFDLSSSNGLSRVFSSTTIQKHQFFDAQSSLCSNSHIHMWLLENQGFDYGRLLQSDVSDFQYAI